MITMVLPKFNFTYTTPRPFCQQSGWHYRMLHCVWSIIHVLYTKHSTGRLLQVNNKWDRGGEMEKSSWWFWHIYICDSTNCNKIDLIIRCMVLNGWYCKGNASHVLCMQCTSKVKEVGLRGANCMTVMIVLPNFKSIYSMLRHIYQWSGWYCIIF